MKKRILGLLLALCMIVGLLPVVAMAAPAPLTVSISKGQLIWNAAADEVYYASIKGSTVTDHGKTEPSEWNIKLDNTQDEAVITLKDIQFNHRGWLLSITEGTSDVKIVVENDCTLSYCLYAINSATTGTTTITGPGKLDLSSIDTACLLGISAKGDLVFDNANIKVFNTVAAERAADLNACVSSGANLTIKGGTLDLEGQSNSKGMVATGALTLQDGAKVDVKIDHPFEHCVKADSIAIKNSSLKAAVMGESGPTIMHYAINKMPALEGVTAQYGPDLETLTNLTLEAGADTTTLEDAVFVIFTGTGATGGTTNGTTSSTNPSTGDNTALVLCFSAMLASAAALFFTKKRIAA